MERKYPIEQSDIDAATLKVAKREAEQLTLGSRQEQIGEVIKIQGAKKNHKRKIKPWYQAWKINKELDEQLDYAIANDD